MNLNMYLMMENIKKRAQILYKRFGKDLKVTMNADTCNQYTDDIERIKEDLYEQDEEWANELEELPVLEEDFFEGPPSRKEITNTAYKSYKQLERILTNLGIDIDEVESPKINTTATSNNMIQASPQTIIHVSPNMYQSQSTNVSVNVNVYTLIKEFEEEISRSYPDKSKLKSMMEQILKFGKEHAGTIVDLILKNWDKIKFGGFF